MHPHKVEDKMKRLATTAAASVLMGACFVAVAMAQGNPRGTSSISLNGKTVSVEYGRPSLKGRTTDDLLGSLPSQGFWRLGADKSTTFKTEADLDLSDAMLPAGEYSLWLQRAVNGNSWNLVFNKQHGQWGTEHDPSQDLVFVPLKQSKAARSVETLILTLRKAASGGTITIQWGTLVVAASFKAK
jgi:hypothetical protein